MLRFCCFNAKSINELVTTLDCPQAALIKGKPFQSMTVFVTTTGARQQIPRSILSSLESAPPFNQNLNRTMIGQQQQQRLSDQQIQQQTQGQLQLQRNILGLFVILSDRRNETFQSGTPI